MYNQKIQEYGSATLSNTTQIGHKVNKVAVIVSMSSPYTGTAIPVCFLEKSSWWRNHSQTRSGTVWVEASVRLWMVRYYASQYEATWPNVCTHLRVYLVSPLNTENQNVSCDCSLNMYLYRISKGCMCKVGHLFMIKQII